MDAEYDAAVIGGGVIGSCAAYSLAKAGKSTVLLDQFPVPHARGSSGGQTRITRLANFGLPELTSIMDDAYKEWFKISDETGGELFTPSPMLVVGSEHNSVKKMISSVSECGHQPKLLTVQQTNDKYKTQFPDNFMSFEDPTAGVLRADKCVLAVQKLFRNAGGNVKDAWPVDTVTPGYPWVKLAGPRGVVRAKYIVLCPGPWASKVLSPLGVNLPLTPQRTASFYWKIKDFPRACFVDCSVHHAYYYGLPAVEYPHLMKVGFHGGRNADPNDDIRKKDISFLREKVIKYFTKYFPTVGSEPSYEEYCMYTLTPDEEFIMDRHPQHGNIVYAVGFSGTGFKLGPVIGDELTRLVLGRDPAHDMSPFKAARFASPVTKKVPSKY